MVGRISIILLSLFLLTCGRAAAGPSVVGIGTGWSIQSSSITKAGGARISTTSYNGKGWYKASVPGTVLGSLVADGLFKNVFTGRHLEQIPDSLFETPWWYRIVFSLPARSPGAERAILSFLGINYRADIWLNGHKIADADSVVGGFRHFNFDISRYAVFDGKNALAVKVYRPGDGAVTLGFVDWNPRPADHDMGIWRPVELHISGNVSISYPFVTSKVDTATLKKASLTVSSVLKNFSTGNVSGTLEGSIGQVHFSQEVSIPARSGKEVVFSPRRYPQLVFMNPRLWWTHDFGKPNLYDLHLRFVTKGTISDSTGTEFGIREISDYMTPQGFRGFKLNGRRILIRGGGWADQIFLEQNRKKLEAQVNYAVNMHLNTLRLEGFWGENSDLYRLCDEKGILIMVGYSAQWEWKEFFGAATDEYGGIKSSEQMNIAARSFKDEILSLRNHPSIFVWFYGSDKIPRPALERRYLAILARYDTTRPALASAAERVSTVTGPTGVKMRGPYDYVPPDYWYEDSSYGGAFGFNTETGPGPQVPRMGSLKRMLSPDSLWPINSQWYFHCSRGEFGNLDRYDSAISGRLGKPQSLSDFERKAQYTSYEAMRAMFEAFGAMKFKATGVIQWMYNSSWPKMWWQLYDYYLNPTGAFYGAQEACRPLHASYDYGSRSIYLVSSTLNGANGLRLVVRELDWNLRTHYDSTFDLSSPPNSSVKIVGLPQDTTLTKTYFLDLCLYRGEKQIDDNFYALSTTPDILDWKKSTWYVTPDTSYADLTDLQNLPPVRLSTATEFKTQGRKVLATVKLQNPTDHLAFMICLSVRQKRTGKAVLPVYWNNNYISLLPGETQTIYGTFDASALHGSAPEVRVTGWNIERRISDR